MMSMNVLNTVIFFIFWLHAINLWVIAFGQNSSEQTFGKNTWNFHLAQNLASISIKIVAHDGFEYSYHDEKIVWIYSFVLQFREL